MKATVLQGNCVDRLGEMESESIDSFVSDPPYGLKFMNKAFDDLGDGAQQREWHRQWLDQAFRVLKKGGVIKAFSGSRTYHHLAKAMYDAGFRELRVEAWIYGCLSEDTEILTDKGWLSYKQLNNGSMVMSYCVDSDTYSYLPVQEIVEYEYKDIAYRIQSDHTDQIVSKNHRCIVERKGRRTFCFAENLQGEEIIPFVESVSVQRLQQNLSDKYHSKGEKEKTLYAEHQTQRVASIDKGMQGVQQRFSNKEEYSEMVQERMYDTAEDHQRMSRLWETVPSTRWESGESESVLQTRMSEETKGGTDLLCLPKSDPSESKKIRESRKPNLLKAMQWGSSWRRMEKTRIQGQSELESRERTSPSGENDWGYQSELERWGDLSQSQGEIYNTENQVCEMPKRVSSYGEKGWVCDGTSSESGTSNWQTIDENRVCSSYQSQRRRQSVGELDVIQEQQRSQTVRGTQVTKTTLATVTPIDYQGVVWCVKVETGAFVARRNGKVFVTGNSGFPKSLNISKQFDKQAGVEGEIVGYTKGVTGENLNDIVSGNDVRDNSDDGGKGVGAYGTGAKQVAIDIPVRDFVTEEAKIWKGWGTALKPAWETIVIAYKPKT